MEAAKEKPSPAVAAAAGLAAAVVGVLWFLAWMGLAAAWQRRTFWTTANLMATCFYGSSAIHSGFAWPTVSGIAVYVILYGILGAVFGLIVRDRLPARRATLAGIVFALAWYYASFHFLWRLVNPLVPLLYTERPMIFGHVIYGALLGRVPAYCRSFAVEPAAPAEPASMPPMA